MKKINILINYLAPVTWIQQRKRYHPFHPRSKQRLEFPDNGNLLTLGTLNFGRIIEVSY